MSTKKQKSKSKSRKTCYNKLPTQVLQKDFNRYILPYLSKGKRGRKPKLSYYKIFNYILYVLHTGIQWNELRTYREKSIGPIFTNITIAGARTEPIGKSLRLRWNGFGIMGNWIYQFCSATAAMWSLKKGRKNRIFGA